LPYSYSDLDALFKNNVELADPSNKEARFEWVVDRLDIVSDGAGGKKLTVASEPTQDDMDPSDRNVAKKVPTNRMTFAERQKQRQELERLEEKRSQMLAQKSERARKVFLAELQEKRRLEQLKAAARMQRITEEREERKEREAMQKRLKEDQRRKYEENDTKRQERVDALEGERHKRDLDKILSIKEQDQTEKKVQLMRLEEARERKKEQEAARMAAEAEQNAALAKKDERRDVKITERLERQQLAKEQYLWDRQKTIDHLGRVRQEKQERKATYLYEKASERAAKLKDKQAKLEAWERLEDQRTRAELKREHDRSMMARSHIENIRDAHNKDLSAANARKAAALEERKQREAAEAEALAEAQRAKSELEQMRNRAIGAKEAARETRYADYVEKIRNDKTAKELEDKAKQDYIQLSQQKSLDQRQEDRKARKEQEDSYASLNASRSEAIRSREKARDAAVVTEIAKYKEAEKQKQVEADAVKIQKRLLDNEKAAKAREELEQKKAEWEHLEKKRLENIEKKKNERNAKEQGRIENVKGADKS